MPLRDYTAGYVCYRRRVLETLDLDRIQFKGKAFQLKMKFKSRRNKVRVVEILIVFVNTHLGTSKKNLSIFGEAVEADLSFRLQSIFSKL